MQKDIYIDLEMSTDEHDFLNNCCNQISEALGDTPHEVQYYLSTQNNTGKPLISISYLKDFTPFIWGFSVLRNYRTYQIELRERNYPSFTGRYNAYIASFGQLSGQYLGTIAEPIALDITAEDAPDLILRAEAFIFDRPHKLEIW